MPAVWGMIGHMHRDGARNRWVRVRTVLSGGVTVCIRAVIQLRAEVTRGREHVTPSRLREGESVEVTYHCGRNGFLAAGRV
jgi:hypothetical protein